MADENMEILNIDEDENTSNHLLQSFQQWCYSVKNTSENSEQVHEKIIALLTQTEVTLIKPGSNKNLDTKFKKYGILIELYEKEIKIVKEYIFHIKEVEKKKNSRLNTFIQLHNELQSKIIHLKKTHIMIKKFILWQKKFDKLNLKIGQYYQALDNAYSSDYSD